MSNSLHARVRSLCPSRLWKWGSTALAQDAVRTDLEAMLFSVKAYIASMLAFYISLKIGLPKPFWAMGTAYLVSQPMSGASVSRGLFRFIGTVVGGSVTVILVPTFANEPLVLSLALASWIGFCLYIGTLDRTPRAYMFLLSGYTTSLIGFPGVFAPEAIFTTAITRVQEISIGVLCATFMHAIVFPRSVSQKVRSRITTVLDDADRLTRDMLRRAKGDVVAKDRARIAADLLEIHQLTVHLPFDTSADAVQVKALRALHARLVALVALSSAIEETLLELRWTSDRLPWSVAPFFDQIVSWLDDPLAIRDANAMERLRHGISVTILPSSIESAWSTQLLDRLRSDLDALIVAHADCRLLEGHVVNAGKHNWRSLPPRILDGAKGYVLHRDRWLAARGAMGATLGLMLGCVFWIVSAWTDGASAISILGTDLALFGTVEAPAANVWRYTLGTIYGCVIGLLYGFVILPHVTDFVSLAAVLAPVLLVNGSLQARPAYNMIALGIILNFPIVAGIAPAYAANFSPALNTSIAVTLGSVIALVSVLLFQTVGSEYSASRIRRAMSRDIAARARGSVDGVMWSHRMMDRVALLSQRVAGSARASVLLRAALADVRVGASVGALRQATEGLGSSRARRGLSELLDQLQMYFNRRRGQSSDRRLEPLIDAVEAAAIVVSREGSAASREALEVLYALHRDLAVALAVEGP